MSITKLAAKLEKRIQGNGETVVAGLAPETITGEPTPVKVSRKRKAKAVEPVKEEEKAEPAKKIPKRLFKKPAVSAKVLRGKKKATRNPLDEVRASNTAPQTEEENQALEEEWLTPFLLELMCGYGGDSDTDDECDIMVMVIDH